MDAKSQPTPPANPSALPNSNRIILRAGQGSAIHKDDLPEAAQNALQGFLFQQSLFPYEFTEIHKKEDPSHPDLPITYTVSGKSVGKEFKLELLMKDGKVTSTHLIS